MRRVCAIIAVATALQGLCETVKTASQPWVTNYVAQAVAGISAPTNVYTKTEVDAKVAPLATTNDLARTARRVKMDAMRHYQSITNAAAGLDYATHQSTLYEVISNYNMMLKILKGDFE